MDFFRVGAVEADGAAYCAHVQPRVGGKRRHIRGPNRPDQQSGMSREDGFAAMDVEADALKAGKPPLQAAVTRTPAACGGVRPKGIWIRVLGPLGLDSELFGPPGLDSWNMAPVSENPCGIFPSVFSSSCSLKKLFSADLSHS